MLVLAYRILASFGHFLPNCRANSGESELTSSGEPRRPGRDENEEPNAMPPADFYFSFAIIRWSYVACNEELHGHVGRRNAAAR